MDRINLSPTAQEILVVFFTNPKQKFYINELIRKTGRYPNSVQQALKSLEKQKILLPSQRGRLKLHALNQSYKFLSEIEGILRKQGKLKEKREEKRIDTQQPEWIRLLGRQSSIPFSNNLAKGTRDLMTDVVDYKQQYYWNNNVTTGVYFVQDEVITIGRLIEEKMKREPKYAKWVAKECRKRADEVVKETKHFKRVNFPELTKKQLFTLLRKYQEVTLKLMPFMTIPHSVESVLEGKIREELEVLCGEAGKIQKYEEYLEAFTTPLEEEANERNDALKIADHVQKFGWNKKANELVGVHTEKYGWIPLDALGREPLGETYFRDEVESLAKKFKRPLAEIIKARQQVKKRRKVRKNLLYVLKVDGFFKDQVEILQAFIFLRTYRRNASAQGHYYLLPLLHELAYRMKITNTEVKHLTYDEMLSWLRHGYGKELDYSYEGLRKETARRVSGWAVLMWKGKIRIISGVENIIEAMERYRIVAPGPQMIKVVKGNPACRGKVTGRVKIVRKLSELDKVGKGDILVAKMTTPDYMMAIRKAVAIVTDEGGVTCHAAIISREFNLPCIVGTKNATQILSDNDLVEVDADEGIVRVIEAVEVDEDIKQIFGKTAYKGKVRGPARIILDANDFPKVREGDILVAPQTTPEYLSSLYKVKGFIVDEESITSHAMLYAKALKLPSVIGTQFARNVLKDGEKIELDASRGVVQRFSN